MIFRQKILLAFILVYFASCVAHLQSVNSSLPKRRLIVFGAQRNRSHFKLLKDPKLAKYFAPDFIWDVRNFKDREEFLRMVRALRNANPKAIIGSYASACTALHAKKRTVPAARIPLEQCKAEWLLRYKDGSFVKWPKNPYRYFLDMRRKDVREASINLAISRAKYNGLDAVCFDNCYWSTIPVKNFPISKQEWTDAFMKFFSEAGKACHKEGLKCVVNVVLNTEIYIPQAFRAIAPYVDGLLTELAFHPRSRTADTIRRELETYEEVLKQGKMVLLIPRYRKKDDMKRKEERFGLTQIRPLAIKYGNIYLTASGPVHDEPLYYVDKLSVDAPAHNKKSPK